MKRLKKSWAWLAFPALCGVAVIGAWAFFANRDADIQWIGPKTENLHAMLDGLDMRVIPADFQECATLEEVLELLEEKCRDKGVELVVSIDCKTTETKVNIPNDPQPMAVKQFLRMALRQVTAKEITFLLSPYHCHVKGGVIRATSADYVDRRRADYEKSHNVTCIDRIHQSFAELLGREGPMPPAYGF